MSGEELVPGSDFPSLGRLTRPLGDGGATCGEHQHRLDRRTRSLMPFYYILLLWRLVFHARIASCIIPLSRCPCTVDCNHHKTKCLEAFGVKFVLLIISPFCRLLFLYTSRDDGKTLVTMTLRIRRLWVQISLPEHAIFPWILPCLQGFDRSAVVVLSRSTTNKDTPAIRHSSTCRQSRKLPSSLFVNIRIFQVFQGKEYG